MSGALSDFNQTYTPTFAPVGLPTSGLVPVNVQPVPANYASPLAGPAERQATEALLGLISGDNTPGGFTGTGLRGDIADVTRGEMNLGPQAGVMKSAADVGRMAQSILGPAMAAPMGPLSMAIAMRNNPAVLGVISNLTNYGAIAEKTAANAARGGPAMGGPKNAAAQFGDQSGDKPGSLSASEAAAQAANAAATNDMGGAKGDPGGGNSDGGSHGGTSTGSSNYAGGGLIELAGGGKLSVGPGSGLDDLIPTSIDGRRAAALSDGEFVIPADVVSMFGDGSSSAGARRLYDLIRSVRQDKTGTSEQAGPLPVGQILKRALG